MLSNRDSTTRIRSLWLPACCTDWRSRWFSARSDSTSNCNSPTRFCSAARSCCRLATARRKPSSCAWVTQTGAAPPISKAPSLTPTHTQRIFSGKNPSNLAQTDPT